LYGLRRTGGCLELEAPAVLELEPEIPEAFDFLFGNERYLVAYGGRGSAKSESIARVLLVRAVNEKLRILCARELQASIKDSVHKLLATLIDEMGLSKFYTVQETVIRGTNGSEFFFKGLRHNIAEIKSTFGVNVCWVEEAQTVSKPNSWNTPPDHP
jgi:phage terminase large subunit